MSDANLMALIASGPEVTYATPPGGTYLDTRYTGESLKMATSSLLSNEMRSDRQKTGSFKINNMVSGDVNVALSYKGFDHLIEDALQADTLFSADTQQTNTGTYSTSGNTITGTGIQTGISVGDVVRLRDGVVTLGYFKTTAVVTGTLTVTPTPPALTGSGNEEVSAGQLIKNGVTLRTRTWQKQFTDLTNAFLQYTGVGVDTWRMESDAQSLWTGAFGMKGKIENRVSVTDASSVTAAATNKVLNGAGHVTSFHIDDSAYSMAKFGWTINNKLRERLEMGAIGPGSLGSGSIEVGGPLELYLKNGNLAQLDNYHDYFDVALRTVLTDPAGNAYYFGFPAAKLTDVQAVAGQEDTDVMLAATWTAFRHATEGLTMKVVRWDN